jgi:hypothetical protein
VEAADTLPTCTVEPSTVKAGESAVLTIIGEHVVDFSFSCDGVTVNSTTQNSATEIKVNFTVLPDATPEECCVTLITDIETVAPIKCCFVITSLDDCLCTLMPNSTIRAGLFSPRYKCFRMQTTCDNAFCQLEIEGVQFESTIRNPGPIQPRCVWIPPWIVTGKRYWKAKCECHRVIF